MYQDEFHQINGDKMEEDFNSPRPVYEKLDQNGKSMQKRTSDGLALASMIIGIISVATMCCLGGFLGIVGIVFGIIALVDKECHRKAKAIIGLTLSAFALLVTILLLGSGTFKKMVNNKKGPEQTEITSELSVDDNQIAATDDKSDRDKTDKTSGQESTTEETAIEETTQQEDQGSDEEAEQDSDSGQDENEINLGDIRPEFKDAVDSYEAFIDEYMDFLDTCMEPNVTSTEILLEYSNYMTKYADLAEKFSKLGDEEMSEAEALYYSAASAKIAAKITEHSAKMMLTQ